MEPTFTIRASDMHAPELVRYWAGRARATGLGETQYLAALKTAKEMEVWRDERST